MFGFLPSDRDLGAVADAVLTPAPEIRLVVTPNLDHVTRLRRDEAFREAYRRSAMVLCDGFPVHAYARLHAHRLHRVTGCDLTERLMRDGPVDGRRWFFVVDGSRTERAVEHWAALVAPGRVGVAVPPRGFIDDASACDELARRIAAFEPSLLVMGVGAPQSEIFVDRSRDRLPACWAICVGQAVKVTLGLVRRAPLPMRTLHLEWLWRIGQEPRRLGRRYAFGAIAFLAAVAEDLLDPEPSTRASDA